MWAPTATSPPGDGGPCPLPALPGVHLGGGGLLASGVEEGVENSCPLPSCPWGPQSDRKVNPRCPEFTFLQSYVRTQSFGTPTEVPRILSAPTALRGWIRGNRRTSLTTQALGLSSRVPESRSPALGSGCRARDSSGGSIFGGDVGRNPGAPCYGRGKPWSLGPGLSAKHGLCVVRMGCPGITFLLCVFPVMKRFPTVTVCQEIQ